MDKVHEERKKNITIGISGLKNLGNTCYLNSILQCLSNVSLFRTWLITTDYKQRLLDNKLKKDPIVEKLTKLYMIIWTQNCQIDPGTIKTIVGETNDIFKSKEQQDSHELLNTLLDMVHEETKIKLTSEDLKRKTDNTPLHNPEYVVNYNEMVKVYEQLNEEEKMINLEKFKGYEQLYINNKTIFDNAKNYWGSYITNQNSIITDLFTGLYYSSLHCDECNNITGSFEPFTILSLPIKEYGNVTLEESLADFVKEERMVGDNKFYCSKCKKDVDATKKMYIWKSPQVLIIQLKRFKNNTYNITDNYSHNTTSKISTVVKFPFENFNIDPYTPDIYKVNKDNGKYDLCAVSCHNGANWSSGHYVSYCKNSVNSVWYKYNDETVTKVEDSKLEKEIVDSEAYILFYVAK